MKPILEKALKAADEIKNAVISVIDEQGYPSGSAVSLVRREGADFYFATGTSTNKARRIMRCGKASACFFRDNCNVTAVGSSQIICDEKLKAELWIDGFYQQFPAGPSDPNFCIIKLTPIRFSLWIDFEEVCLDATDFE